MQETLPLLQAAGITPAEDIASSRKLRFATNQKDVRLLVLRVVLLILVWLVKICC
jgi:ATP phosphoribosyltransferase